MPPNKSLASAIRAAILRIPQGKVSTYGQVAAMAGYPGYHRQVAQLLGKSDHGLPWHRVVGAGGAIKTRFEVAAEQRLRLQIEGVRFRGRNVDMKLSGFVISNSRRNS